MNNLRIVEVLSNNIWERTRLSSIKQGQIFRMFEDENVPVVYNGKSEFVALSDGTPEGVEI